METRKPELVKASIFKVTQRPLGVLIKVVRRCYLTTGKPYLSSRFVLTHTPPVIPQPEPEE